MLRLSLTLLILISQLQPLNSLQTQSYEVAVQTVTVWVRVLDKKGNPVRGLVAEDFRVFEDKENVSLTCFEEIGLKQQSDDAMAQSDIPLPRKHLILYLDLFSLNNQEYNDLRSSVINCLDNLPRTRWQIMVAGFMPNGSLRILEKRTEDLQQVKSLFVSLPVQTERDLNNLKKSNEIFSILRNLGSEIGEEQIIRQACRAATVFADEEKQIAQHSIKALETLMNSVSMESPEEQKMVVYFSAGFNSDPGRVYFELIEKTLEKDPDELVLEHPECKRELTFHPARDVQALMGGMNRSNVTLYSINARALYPGTTIPAQRRTIQISESSILNDYRSFQAEMAEESGGLFYPNIRKFDDKLSQLLNDLEHYYELCYTPPDQNRKKGYRKISVKSMKKGVEIRHRRGYID